MNKTIQEVLDFINNKKARLQENKDFLFSQGFPTTDIENELSDTEQALLVLEPLINLAEVIGDEPVVEPTNE